MLEIRVLARPLSSPRGIVYCLLTLTWSQLLREGPLIRTTTPRLDDGELSTRVYPAPLPKTRFLRRNCSPERPACSPEGAPAATARRSPAAQGRRRPQSVCDDNLRTRESRTSVYRSEIASEGFPWPNGTAHVILGVACDEEIIYVNSGQSYQTPQCRSNKHLSALVWAPAIFDQGLRNTLAPLPRSRHQAVEGFLSPSTVSTPGVAPQGCQGGPNVPAQGGRQSGARQTSRLRSAR